MAIESGQVIIRDVLPEDEPFLWAMLYEAANMAQDGASSPDEARTHPFLAKYVHSWGQPGDIGVIAVDARDGAQLGAAWARLLTSEDHALMPRDLPELAIAVQPHGRGRGLGSALIAALIERMRGRFRGLALSVREENPALRLYRRAGFETIDVISNRVGGRSLVMQIIFERAAE